MMYLTKTCITPNCLMSVYKQTDKCLACDYESNTCETCLQAKNECKDECKKFLNTTKCQGCNKRECQFPISKPILCSMCFDKSMSRIKNNHISMCCCCANLTTDGRFSLNYMFVCLVCAQRPIKKWLVSHICDDISNLVLEFILNPLERGDVVVHSLHITVIAVDTKHHIYTLRTYDHVYRFHFSEVSDFLYSRSKEVPDFVYSKNCIGNLLEESSATPTFFKFAKKFKKYECLKKVICQWCFLCQGEKTVCDCFMTKNPYLLKLLCLLKKKERQQMKKKKTKE